jgi:hypothetical protein
MLTVLRYGWLVVPSIVIFLNAFGALVAPEAKPVPSLLVETAIATLQWVAIFSSVVVLIFALLERAKIELHEPLNTFTPLEMPEIDDPGSVDCFETAFGIAFGTIFTLVLLYFLSVGGLTLRFTLGSPGEVIPVSMLWLVLLILNGLAMILLNLLVLRRNRWGSSIWFIETALEVFGHMCLYFVLYRPLFQRFAAAFPAFATLPVIDKLPEILAIGLSVLTLVSRSGKLVSLWNYSPSPPMLQKQKGHS